MNHSSTQATRLGRFSAVALAILMFGAVLASCTPSTPGGGGGNQQFCDFWEKVEEEPPAEDNAVLVKDDVVALADDTTVTGQECTDSGAMVELDGAVLAEGEEVDAEEGNPDSETIAAVTGEEIGGGEPVLENLSLQTLSAEIGPGGITVRGNVRVTLSGVTSTIGFTGTFSNLDNWSVGLSSAGLTIPGITSSPVVFNGTLRVTNGVPSLSMSAQASFAETGDITVTGATINLFASPATGVDATVSGSIKVGPSTANGTVNVVFDNAGALVSANAEIDAHLVGTGLGGTTTDMTGTVTLEGNADETVVTFSGSGLLDDVVVNEANGELTLATNKATFVGVIDIADGPNYLRFNGSIVWDGITAYTPFLTLEGGGEYSGTLNDGSTVTVAGDISTEIIGGQARTVVTGDFNVGTLQASGSAIVETNGATTALYVDADLVDAGFDASLEGAVVITDGLAEQVSLDASVNGALTFGDVTMTGANLHIGASYGSPLDLEFSGGLQVGSQADVNGSIAATFGPNGSLLSLEGQVNGSLNLDSWGIASFSGSVIASSEQVTLSGSGTVSTLNFPLGISFNGSFTSSLTTPSWSLNGSGNFRIASINVASARLSMSQGVGVKATRVGFYFTVLIFPSYFEADFYMLPGGGCSRVDVTGGSFLMKPLLRLALPGVVGCPVY